MRSLAILFGAVSIRRKSVPTFCVLRLAGSRLPRYPESFIASECPGVDAGLPGQALGSHYCTAQSGCAPAGICVIAICVVGKFKN